MPARTQNETQTKRSPKLPPAWNGANLVVLALADNPLEYLSHPSSVPGEWAVAQTRSRQEKSLATAIASPPIGPLDYFLPYQASRNAARSLTLTPFFPGIVFIALPSSPESRAAALDLLRAAPQVYGFLFTKNQRRLRQELAALASEHPTERTLQREAALPIGTSVAVTEGPMQGLEGTVHGNLRPHETEPRPRFYVDMPLMGTVVSLEIDRNLLEPAQ